MADPTEHAKAAYPGYFRHIYNGDLRSERLDRIEQRLARLEKRAEEESLVKPAPNWREHITPFDPNNHGEWPWEETLVSLGVLFGAQMNWEPDQVKKSLARIVSICEHMEQRRMVPGDIKPIQMNAKVLFTYFQPEGSEEEAATNRWCYGELGDLAASWLRSLYA